MPTPVITTWDDMEALAEKCRTYIEWVQMGVIPNGSPEALQKFQEWVAPRLSPLMLLVLVEAWQEKNPRPDAQN